MPSCTDPAAIEAWLDGLTLHRDAAVRVIDKPAGLAVQRGTRTLEDLDSLLAARAGTGEGAGHERLRLVHRLDRDTAGCLLLAASRDAARLLGREFAARRVVKTYWAVVAGVPEPRAGTIDLPLVKATTPAGDRVRPALAHEIDRAWPALTRYEVLQAGGTAYAWLALNPETGRQHQLRAHLAAIGHPILGDALHAPAADPTQPAAPLHLLARGLAFRHPNGQWVSVTAPLPAHMRSTFDRLGFGPGIKP